MDTTTNVWDRLLHHIKLFLDLSDEKKIKEEDQLIDLGINSIDYIKIVLVLESEFGFEFDDEALDMKNISNVRLLYQYICKKLSKD